MLTRSRLIVLIGIFALLAAGTVYAQSQATTGVIEGAATAADDGSALPGVTVTLLNTDTNFEQTVVTDGRGRYRGVLLPLGPYKVTAVLDTFATLVVEDVRLTVGATLNVPLKMQISAVEQEIVVTGGTPLIETSSPQSSTSIDRETLDGIPNNGRNFLEFTKMTPGVATVQGPDGDELIINGQKGIQYNLSVDGADFNNPFFGGQRGGQRPAFTFNIDAVQEFVVVPDGAPAEFGRSSSGFVNVVTKSGTNQVHGTANLFFENDSFSTAPQRLDGTEEPKADSEQFQVGATIGGALRPDRLFYFLAVDAQDGDETKQKDPNRIEQRVVDLFASLGSPGENGPITRTDEALAALAKFDFHLSDNHLFTTRASYTDSEQANGTFDVDSWGASANATEKDSSYALTGTLISTFSSSVLNELRFQYARENRPRPYEGPTFTDTGRPFPDTGFDFVNQYRFGMPFFIPVEYHDTRWQVNNNVSFLRGDHTIKAGIEWNQTAASQTFIGFANGRFIFSSTDGFINYVNNPNYVECSDGSSSQDGSCPAGASITGPVLLYLQLAGVDGLTPEQAGTQTITQNEYAVFLQDTWQPLSNLTISYGLRWEAQVQPDPITPSSEVFYADFIGRTVDGQLFPSDGTIPSDEEMWQPRLGVTWDPTKDGKTVIRASAGLYNARIPGLVLAGTRTSNGSRGQTLFRSSEASPFLGPVPAYGQLIDASNAGTPFRPDITVFDRDFENPETLALALGIERELSPNLVGSLKYNYAKTENNTRFINANDPLLGAVWTSGLNGTDNGINTLTVVQSTAESLYRGITAGIQGNYRKVQFNAFYTYSKDRSDDDNERDPFTFRYARITDLDAEWSYSDRDQRDRFNGWLLWQAPWDLNVNVRYTYRSPQPKSITADGSDAATPQDRINADGTVTRRNLGRKDNKLSSIDVRFSKIFQVGNLDVEAIAEVFNLTNETNLRSPENTNLVFNFDGTIQSGLGDPRQWQLGVRLRW